MRRSILMVRIVRQGAVMTEVQNDAPVAETWTVDGLTLAGLTFGPSDGIPILALHGWLDNAGSFETLAPLISNARIVAIDLPGHGLSDHRSQDATYQVWDDLPQLFGLLDKLGWEKCILLGHSRGGMISTLMASTMPERFVGLVTLDGMLPFPAADESAINQLRSFINDRTRLSKKAKRVFSSKEDFVERRARTGEPKQIASKIAERALRETKDGFEWRGDPRLSGASALKFNENQCDTVLKALDIPVLNIWATPNARLEKMSKLVRAKAGELIENLRTVDVPGHHHWHMDVETAQQIAANIKAFIADIDVQ